MLRLQADLNWNYFFYFEENESQGLRVVEYNACDGGGDSLPRKIFHSNKLFAL